MSFDRAAFEKTDAALRRALLAARNEAGYWEAAAPASALATATAVIALQQYRLKNDDPSTIHATDRLCADRIRTGLNWLALNQRADGGWGDANVGRSDVMFTLAARAAFAADSAAAPAYASVAAAADAWLATHAGGATPEGLARALPSALEPERAFAAALLTLAALAGLLGPSPECWRHVPQFPFERAGAAHGTLLPAYLATGLARHRGRPTSNPVARLARAAATRRTLRIIEEAQRPGGDYDQSAAITAFVAAGLCGAGEVGSPAVRRAVGFLLRAANAGGGWTGRATHPACETSLAAAAVAENLSHAEAAELLRWLVAAHDEADALSDGDLPDFLMALHALRRDDAPSQRPTPNHADTAEPLRALREAYDAQAPVRRAAVDCIERLLDRQSDDGSFISADMAAGVLDAFRLWRGELEEPLRGRTHDASLRAVRALVRQQLADGSWSPLPGGTETPDVDEAIGCTARVVRAAFAIPLKDGLPLDWPQALWRGVRWLMDQQLPDGNWPTSLASTAAAVEALAHVLGHDRAVRAGIDPDRDDHWTVFHKMDEVLIDGEQDAMRVSDAAERGAGAIIAQTHAGENAGEPHTCGNIMRNSRMVVALRHVRTVAVQDRNGH